MGVDIKGMESPEHVRKLRRDALGQGAGHPGPDADDFYVGNGPNLAKDSVEFPVREEQGIAP